MMPGVRIASAAASGYDFLVEPTVTTDLAGAIVTANAAARGRLGDDVTGRGLLDLVTPDQHDAARRFLRLAAGASAPRIGGLTVTTGAGRERFRIHGARLAGSKGAAPGLVLRFLSLCDDRFTLLDRQVRELDRQLLLRARCRLHLVFSYASESVD